MFKISARTVLELGAELISSDVVAFYELIKNGFDAGSPNGVEIRFEITLCRNACLKFLKQAKESSVDLAQLKADIVSALEPSGPVPSLARFRSAIAAVMDSVELAKVLKDTYDAENRIIVSDLGSGMSQSDLKTSFLTIGTPSRQRAIDAALVEGAEGKPPFRGEKGIGRLSAMRLGERLTVETATKKDPCFNLLHIDWHAFNDLDAMVEDIDVKPVLGQAKPSSDWCGTRLVISALWSNWTPKRVDGLGGYDFACLTDPFEDGKQRPRIAMFWNDERRAIDDMNRLILEEAHATAKGIFKYENKQPVLEYTLTARYLGFEHPYKVEKQRYVLPDLIGFVVGILDRIPVSALDELGEFSFEIYWFNRRLLNTIDSIGSQKEVRELQKLWSGIQLYRDGFRVLPYGEDADDWLGLDRKALSSTGYLLNKTQFVGRVRITRLGNPSLRDLSNREGLQHCSEQEAFIEVLRFTIQDQLRDFITDIQMRYKNKPRSLKGAKNEVHALVERADLAFKQIKNSTNTTETLEELQHSFFGIKERFDNAMLRIQEVEHENHQMMQMAGVGLLVEVVAHELARSTEHTLDSLKSLGDQTVSVEVDNLLRSLKAEMASVNKRIRVLDPLSVSGRQKKKTFNITTLIKAVLVGHESQFRRHQVGFVVENPEHLVRIHAVEGMMVQILENLLSNSIYWLKLRKKNEYSFQPKIQITIETNPLTITYEDNGRGIAKEYQEKVFNAFFSLKEKTSRRGLGLYIARDCAKHHKGTLILDDKKNPDTGRLNRFILTLPSEVVIP